MRSLAIGCLALLALALAAVRAPAQSHSPSTEAGKRFIRLLRSSTGPELRRAETIVFPQWMLAAQAHVPGKDDAAARAIAAWTGEDLDAVLKWVLFQFTASDGDLRGRNSLTKARLAELVKRGLVMHSDIALLVTPDSSCQPTHLPSRFPPSQTSASIRGGPIRNRTSATRGRS